MASESVTGGGSATLTADPMKEPLDRPDGEMLPADLVRVQLQAKRPDPKPVPLVFQKKAPEDGEAGPPTPPLAAAEPVPRLIHQNERVPPKSGLVRYKVRCLNYGEAQPTRYVLARNEKDARKTYLRDGGLDAVMAAVGPDAPAPRLSVKALPD
jgi:hypothetical protein